MVATTKRTRRTQGLPKSQNLDFKTGNEMAALAAKHINFHIMGYFPITPSTEIAEYLDEMYAEGEHDIRLVAADGEHGGAGICYGASTGGGRVFNATSSQGLLYSLEQFPVQSGTRFPMVLDLVTRSINGPLDIRGDHSDLYFALNTGWIILLARNPQAVYDLNIVAVRLSEHPEVRLPVIVAYDGFFTSHQKRQVSYFEDRQPVQEFLGSYQATHTTLDPRNPITVGPYMNDPDLINSKYQLNLAMEAAHRVLPQILEEYGSLSGRTYPTIDKYRMEDAEVALVLLNSAAETAKDAADQLREQGLKVGVVSPNVLRPFPAEEIRDTLRNTRAVLIAERADSYGGHGNALTHEVKAALKDDPTNQTLCLSRIYGLGGKDFLNEDAEALFHLALKTADTGKVEKLFDYHGITQSNPNSSNTSRVIPPFTKEEMKPGLVSTTREPETGEIQVQIPPLWKLATRSRIIAPGHGACPGCGIFPALDQLFKGMEGDIVVLYQTGCAMVVTTGFPFSSHRVTYIHNLFQNGAATLSGLVEMFHEKQRRGEIPDDEDITFVMVTGDGGMDIGMGPTIGAALRNHKMIILEYDNQGYMNTGSQLSYSTPIGHMTTTSHVGSAQGGKPSHHKDTLQIMAACHIPYVFSSVEGYADDLVKKAAKAQWYAKNEGLAFGKVLISCPLNWRIADETGTDIVQEAVDCNFFPLYEMEHGKTKITYDPEPVGRKISVSQWLGRMGKTRHLTRPEYKARIEAFETEVERRWRRLKAMHEHPDL
ncbi:MAG: thiamine pyrophosphate-dependent enzyme [Dehalococcoidia bacterium]|nr:thiamine pyrophosphate-dependent enzyme [Dehalococcoidia bacterium]